MEVALASAAISITKENMSGNLTATRQFDGIQYLRAIAAVMVVVHHARDFFPDTQGWTGFGATGVDIFFVISGFIMAHATRHFDQGAAKIPYLVDFLMKRLIRVVPLYWLALLYRNKRGLVEGSANPAIIQDFFFIPRFNEWQDNQILPSLVPGWTINYEMLFYAIFCVAFIFGRKRYVALIGTIALLCLAGASYPFASAPLKFWTSSILLEFVMGLGVYWLFSHRREPSSNWLPALIFVAGVFGLCFDNLFNLPRSLVHGPFAAMIVWSGIYLGRRITHQKWLHLLGDASYSIYLVHQFTFVASSALCKKLNLVETTAFNIASALFIQTAIAVAIGLIVHRTIEKPLLKYLQNLWLGKSGLMRSRPAAP